MQPESGRIAYAGSDFPYPFQLRFFQRRHGSHCAKPTRIRFGWPGHGLAKHILSGTKLVCGNHRARFLAGRNRPATSFPIFRLGSVLPQTSQIILCAKPARIRFGSGWLCQVLAKRIRSGRKPVCKNHPARFWPMLPSRSGPDTSRTQHVYWDRSRILAFN